jgi:hypothetical protein
MDVHARLAGHGVTVVPRAPFAFERHGGRGGDAVVVSHFPAGGLPRRLVLVPEAGGCRVDLGAGVAAPAEVADVAAGSGAAFWTIETSAFSMGWPDGFVLRSGPAPEEPPGFDLIAPGGVLLFPQGPYPTERVADRRALIGPGQRVVGEGVVDGAGWIELSYTHEATPWRQRHAVIPVRASALVLTLQSPETSADTPAWRAALEAARTVRRA